MRNSRLYIGTILSCVLLTGCDVDLSALGRVGDLEDKVRVQGVELKNLAVTNERLSNEVFALRAKVMNQELEALFEDVPAYEELSLTEKNYSIVKTNLGTLLFLVEDISPYAGGSKVNIAIGNINAVTYAGVKVDAVWANANPKTQGFQPDSQQSKSINLLGDVASGAWTVKEIVLPGTKPEDLGYLSVQASVSQVKLRTAAKL